MELDRGTLEMIIDQRVAMGIKEWYQTWLLPLHNDNKAELHGMRETLGELVAAFNQARGGLSVAKAGMTVADKILAGIGGISLLLLSALIGHFWK